MEQRPSGWYERLLRKFRTPMEIASIVPMFFMAALCLGIAAAPGIAFYQWMDGISAEMPSWGRYPFLGVGISGGYFIYGFTLLTITPIINWLLRTNLKAWKGPYHSAKTAKWYIHNALTYLPRYTFLDFITPTPFNILFYRAMGMRIGKGTHINTTFISDPSLIELGERVTVGGSVTLIGHYGVGGLLVLAPTKIGNGTTLGLKCTIFGGVTIGENVKIMPNSVVLPGTTIPAGETWGGVPAQKFEKRPKLEKVA